MQYYRQPNTGCDKYYNNCRPSQRQQVFLFFLDYYFIPFSFYFLFSLSSLEPENELGVAAKTGRPQDEMGKFFFYGEMGWESKQRLAKEDRNRARLREITGREGVTKGEGKIELQGGKGNAPRYVFVDLFICLFIYLFYCIFFIIISGYCFFGLDTRFCWKSCTCQHCSRVRFDATTWFSSSTLFVLDCSFFLCILLCPGSLSLSLSKQLYG